MGGHPKINPRNVIQPQILHLSATLLQRLPGVWGVGVSKVGSLHLFAVSFLPSPQLPPKSLPGQKLPSERGGVSLLDKVQAFLSEGLTTHAPILQIGK